MDHLEMKLLVNGKPAEKGMEVTTFRGEKYILEDWREPHKAGSTGRVYCKKKGELFHNEWFPGVIGAEFVERKE